MGARLHDLHNHGSARWKYPIGLWRFQIHHHSRDRRRRLKQAHANSFHRSDPNHRRMQTGPREGVGKINHQAIWTGDHLGLRHHRSAGVNLQFEIAALIEHAHPADGGGRARGLRDSQRGETASRKNEREQ